MNYRLDFTADAEEHLRFWQQNDKRTLKRIRALLANMQETPYTGLGKPEALRFEWSGCYSRRIDAKNRIVYEVNEEEGVILIHRLRHHY